MPNATVTEIVTRPSASAAATGTYSGDEFIAQNGQTLSLDLTKSASLAAPATSSTLAFTANASESLSETVTVTGGQVMINFSLSLDVNVSITKADGTVIPFDTNVSVFGDLVAAQPKSGCDGQSQDGRGDGGQSYGGYGQSHGGQSEQGGQDCGGRSGQGYGGQGGQDDGGKDGHGGDCGGKPTPDFTLTDADTSYAFNAPAANGFDALVVANNQPTSSIGNATVTDASTANQGAAGIFLAASLMQAVFGSASPDPVQGISGDDADLMRVLAAAALAMIAQPTSQATATAAALAATFAGGQLALDDGLAAFGVAANAQSPVNVSATPVAVMPGQATHTAAGSDMFMVDRASGSSTILGFTPGVDQVRVDPSLAGGFAGLLADATQTPQGVAIAFAPGHVLTLAGVSLAGLHAADFVFG